jgi:predicted  nucleic acid-binding Zn-ribbon protein
MADIDDAIAAARHDLESSANRILPERSGRWGDTSDRNVRLAVLSYLAPGVRFDDASDARVQGRYKHEISRHTGQTMTTRHDAESVQARMYRLQGELSDARMQASVTANPAQRAELEARASEIHAEIKQIRDAADRSVPQLAAWQMPLTTSTSSVAERLARSQLPEWQRPTSKSKRTAVETRDRQLASTPDWKQSLSANSRRSNDYDA